MTMPVMPPSRPATAEAERLLDKLIAELNAVGVAPSPLALISRATDTQMSEAAITALVKAMEQRLSRHMVLDRRP
jgi:hypothetical protein